MPSGTFRTGVVSAVSLPVATSMEKSSPLRTNAMRSPVSHGRASSSGSGVFVRRRTVPAGSRAKSRTKMSPACGMTSSFVFFAHRCWVMPSLRSRWRSRRSSSSRERVAVPVSPRSLARRSTSLLPVVASNAKSDIVSSPCSLARNVTVLPSGACCVWRGTFQPGSGCRAMRAKPTRLALAGAISTRSIFSGTEG